MLHISPVTDLTQKAFEELFKAYFSELDCEENAETLLAEQIIPDLQAGMFRADILKDGETFAGFVVYQRDDIDNDWNVREGWGDIREIYVIPSHRRQGLGRFLLYTAEMKLRESGADKCYCMPTDPAEAFFTACGYARGNEYSEDLDCFVYEKLDITNKCK